MKGLYLKAEYFWRPTSCTLHKNNPSKLCFMFHDESAVVYFSTDMVCTEIYVIFIYLFVKSIVFRMVFSYNLNFKIKFKFSSSYSLCMFLCLRCNRLLCHPPQISQGWFLLRAKPFQWLSRLSCELKAKRTCLLLFLILWFVLLSMIQIDLFEVGLDSWQLVAGSGWAMFITRWFKTNLEGSRWQFNHCCCQLFWVT